MVRVHMVVCLMVVATIALLSFVGGVLYVVDGAYTAARQDLMNDLRHEFRQAVVEGVPFYLPGSNIRLIPRKDGHMNAVQIAGAGAETPIREVRRDGR